jgi:RNA polymerase sigma factor for flagellar operon FliA
MPDTTRLVDGMTRHELCEKYQKKIIMLARRLASRLPDSVGITREDLASYGAIGLLEAFDHFDESQNIKFTTYAEYRIRGSMLDALRANDTMSRRRRTLARRIQDCSNHLAHKLGREPVAEEVAQAMDMDMDSYWQAVNKTAQVTLLSMDESSDDGDEGLSLGETRVQAPGRDVLQLMLDQGSRDELKQAIMALPDRSRQCVLLYYGRNLTLAEIAKVFDLTPSRISQILSDARRRLRCQLEQAERGEAEKES